MRINRNNFTEPEMSLLRNAIRDYDNQDYDNAFSAFDEIDYKYDNYVSKYYLGLCFYNGYGTDRDYNEAYKYFYAAKDAVPEAQCKLGECYRLGRGIKKDIDEAQKWYTKAQKWYTKALNNNRQDSNWELEEYLFREIKKLEEERYHNSSIKQASIKNIQGPIVPQWRTNLVTVVENLE